MSNEEPKSTSNRITFVDIPIERLTRDPFPAYINPAFEDPVTSYVEHDPNKRPSQEEVFSESRSSWRRLQLARAKLKMATKNSALLAGFAMVPMVELGINDDEDDPIPLSILMSFGIVTTALIAVHLSAVMIASCILPYIDSIALSETESSDKESIQDSPHDKMHLFIETSWIFSNIIGLVLFLVEIILLTWVKFWQIGAGDGNDPGKQVAIAGTVTLLICIIFFIWFAVYFYKSLADHEYERFKTKLQQVEGGFDRKRKLSVWAKDQFKRRKSSVKSFFPSFGRRKSSVGITRRTDIERDNAVGDGNYGTSPTNRTKRGTDNLGYREQIV